MCTACQAILTRAQLDTLPAELTRLYPHVADRLRDPTNPLYVWTGTDDFVGYCVRHGKDFYTVANAYEHLVYMWFRRRLTYYPRPAVWKDPAPERPIIPEEDALPAEQLQQLMSAQAAGPPERPRGRPQSPWAGQGGATPPDRWAI